MRLATPTTFAWLAIALAAALPATVRAQDAVFTLAWNAPWGLPGADVKIPFDCLGGAVTHRAYVTLTPSVDIPSLTEARWSFVLGSVFFGGPLPGGPPIDPFWHFEEGGCNEGGLSARIPPESESGLPPVFTPGGLVFATYAPDAPLAGYGRLVMDLPSMGTTSLVGGQTYVLLELDFSMCRAPVCSGCSEGFCLLSQDRIELSTPTSTILADCSDYCGIAINAGCSVVAQAQAAPPGRVAAAAPVYRPLAATLDICDPVPALRHSWGDLKLLYR